LLPFTGEHGDLDIQSKSAFSLRIKGRHFLFLADSDGRDRKLYQRIMNRIGPVDVVFLGMECHGAPLTWLYEPILSKGVNRRHNESRRLSGADSKHAWDIIREVKPSKVYVYAMGQEPWLKYLMGLEYQQDAIQLIESNKLIAMCHENYIGGERLFGTRELIF